MCDTCFIWFILNGSEEHQTQEFTICLERSNPDPCQRILEKLRTSQVGPGKRAWKFKLSHHDLSKTWKNKPSGGKTKEKQATNQENPMRKKCTTSLRIQHPSNSPDPSVSHSSGLFAAEDKGSIPSCRLESEAWSQLALRLPKYGSEEAREGNATGSRNPEPVNFKTLSLSEWHHQSCGPSWRACLPPCRCIGGWPAHDCSE